MKLKTQSREEKSISCTGHRVKNQFVRHSLLGKIHFMICFCLERSCKHLKIWPLHSQTHWWCCSSADWKAKLILSRLVNIKAYLVNITMGFFLDFIFTATHWDGLLNLARKDTTERVRLTDELPLIFHSPATGKIRPWTRFDVLAINLLSSTY